MAHPCPRNLHTRSTLPSGSIDPAGADRAALPTEGIFVGREAEMEVLCAGLESAQAGHGRLILLAGEPGIGKTRTAQEIASRARRQDADVAMACCQSAEGAPPFWPWVQIVRALASSRTPEALRAQLGSGAADIAHVIGAVQESLADLPAAPALESAEARFRLFDSMSAFLRNVGRGRPLVLVLDDIHEADRASLLLLVFLAHDLQDARVLIVVTYRDMALHRQHPLSRTLGDLVRLAGHQRLLLEGLSRGEVARFVELAVGVAPTEATVTSLHGRTEGNPFFLAEVVRTMIAKGAASGPRGSLAASSLVLPQGVRDAVGRRLETLARDHLRVLSLASVIGRDFDFETLAHVSTVDRDGLLSTLDAALAARIIVEHPSSRGRYSFAHALIRETLYADLPTATRQRLHRDIGLALEDRWGLRAAPTTLPSGHDVRAGARPVVGELAYHFFEAARGGDEDEPAIAYAVEAGRQAMGVLAYEEAALQYSRALETLDRTNPGHAVQRSELLLALGGAQMRAGEDVASARETLFRAAAAARCAGLPELLARVALGFEKLGVEIGSVDQPLISLLEEALNRLPAEDDSELRARILARLALELLYSVRCSERRNRLSQEAVAIARRIDAPAALAAALQSRRVDLWGPGQAQERLDAVTELIGLAETSGDRERAMRGRFERIADLLQLGEMRAVDVELDAYLRMADELRQPRYLWYGHLIRATRALLDGRFDEAERWAREAFLLGQRVQPRTAATFLGAQLVWSYREQGRLQELEAAVQDFAARSPGLPAWRSALASLYSELGREAEARREFERLAVNDFSDLPRDNSWLIATSLAGEVCAFLGDGSRARVLYALLEPYGGHVAVSGGDAVVCSGPVSRILGLLAATSGRGEDAARHFEAALSMARGIGARALLARVQCEYAELLLARPDLDASHRSCNLVDETLDAARELGMKALEEKALALRRRVAPPVSPARGVSGDAQQASVGARPRAEGYVFRREADYWTLMYHGTTCRLRDTKGLRAIAVLLRAPGQEFHVLDMMTILQGGQSATTGTGATTELPSSPHGDLGVLLDREAKAAYRRRLTELRDDLAEAEQRHDLARAERARAEIEWLTRQLSAGLGLGGRHRKLGAAAERARSTITKSIKTAIRKIRNHHRILGHHLATHIKTGAFCQYLSVAEQPICWTV